ncbi:MAG: hypothetical protein NUW01_01705 [Gemmatimonadaceae bacterium]|nr:hypothetical protein [Gemmatimonadaceae bacterium]
MISLDFRDDRDDRQPHGFHDETRRQQMEIDVESARAALVDAYDRLLDRGDMGESDGSWRLRKRRAA